MYTRKLKYDILIPLGIALALILARIALPSFKAFFLQVTLFTVYVMGNNILMGYLGLVSFGQPLYLSFGGYAAGLYLAYLGHNPVIAFGLSILSGLVIGIIMGPVLLRLRGSYFTLVNAAFCAIGVFTFETLLINITNGNNGLLFRGQMSPGLPFLDLRRPDDFFFFALIIMVIVMLLYRKMDQSVLGAMFRATEKNEQRMNFLGYNTFNIRWTGFILAAVISTTAGGLFAINNAMINPSLGEQSRASEVVVATLIGGSGTIYGPFFGALGFLGIKEIITNIIRRWELLVGIMTLLIMFRFEKGIWGFALDFYHKRKLKTVIEKQPRKTEAQG
jgi:branched-chain amino acid transport system permease protein